MKKKISSLLKRRKKESKKVPPKSVSPTEPISEEPKRDQIVAAFAPDGAIVYALFNRHGRGSVQGLTTSLHDANIWHNYEKEYRKIIEVTVNEVKLGFDHFGPPGTPISQPEKCSGDLFVLLNRHGGSSIQGAVSNRQKADEWREIDRAYREIAILRVDDIDKWDDDTK